MPDDFKVRIGEFEGPLELLLDLVEKIRFYQRPENLEELAQIARRGCELVSGRFRAELVYAEFLKRLTNSVSVNKNARMPLESK